MNYNYGELSNDNNFVSKVQASSEAIAKIQKTIQDAISEMNTEKMTAGEKVKFDLFLIFAVDSLYFMYLKANGSDISSHGIKHELGRIKEAMQRNQAILDRSLRPTVNKDVANKFIRSGLYDHKKKNTDFKRKYDKQQQPQAMRIDINYNPHRAVNKKRKFEDD